MTRVVLGAGRAPAHPARRSLFLALTHGYRDDVLVTHAGQESVLEPSA